jgi:hypothetical protein
MPTFVQVGATLICPHGGQIQIVPGNARVSLSSQPAGTVSDQYMVAGCSFMIGTKPQPCMTVQWIVPATRVTIGGQPAVLQSSTGMCMSADQIPNGPPQVVVTQLRAQGT